MKEKRRGEREGGTTTTMQLFSFYEAGSCVLSAVESPTFIPIDVVQNWPESVVCSGVARG